MHQNPVAATARKDEIGQHDHHHQPGQWEPMRLVGLYIPAVKGAASGQCQTWHMENLGGFRSETDCLAECARRNAL